jgi:hypothetical protein
VEIGPKGKKIVIWICLICNHRQENERVQDFNRHMKTHDGENPWLCCGAPLGTRAAERFMTLYPTLVEKTRRRYFETDLVGGCKTRFSRRDALKRHLDNTNNPCVGDTAWYAMHLPDDKKKKKQRLN